MIDPRLATSAAPLTFATAKPASVANETADKTFKALLQAEAKAPVAASAQSAPTRAERLARFEKPRVGVPIAPFTPQPDALSLADTQNKPWLVSPASGRDPAREGPTLADAVDIINPLQHIPLVGQVYRGITGDEISGPARFIGGTIYGGPLGAALAMADVALKDKTGHSFSEAVVARMEGAPEITQVATENTQTDDRAFSLMVKGLVQGDQAQAPHIS